jgi:tripartite-type tricarboxylate transporter receptor subunit TctC
VVIGKLNAEMIRILRMPDVVERLGAMGVEIVGSTPEEFARVIRADVVKWGKVVRDSGAKAD